MVLNVEAYVEDGVSNEVFMAGTGDQAMKETQEL